MTSAIEALKQYGIGLEYHWPYVISRVNTRPKKSAYLDAKNHKITQAFRVKTNLHDMKSCLAQGFPFAFGLKLYTSFDKADRTGVVPIPSPNDIGRQSDGRFI
jgi:C1A family cysteine protease